MNVYSDIWMRVTTGATEEEWYPFQLSHCTACSRDDAQTALNRRERKFSTAAFFAELPKKFQYIENIFGNSVKNERDKTKGIHRSYHTVQLACGKRKQRKKADALLSAVWRIPLQTNGM